MSYCGKLHMHVLKVLTTFSFNWLLSKWKSQKLRRQNNVQIKELLILFDYFNYIPKLLVNLKRMQKKFRNIKFIWISKLFINLILVIHIKINLMTYKFHRPRLNFSFYVIFWKIFMTRFCRTKSSFTDHLQFECFFLFYIEINFLESA